MVFPWVEEYLEKPHSSQKKLLENTYEWMIKDSPLKAATNMESLNASLAKAIKREVVTKLFSSIFVHSFSQFGRVLF